MAIALSNHNSRVIDVAIAIVLFKEMLNQDERARILSQSDQIQEWRDTLAQSEFLDQSSQYLTKVEVEAEQNPLEPVTFLFFLFSNRNPAPRITNSNRIKPPMNVPVRRK